MVVLLIHLLLLPLAAWFGWRVWTGPVARRLAEAAAGTVLFAFGIIGTAAVTLDVGAVFFGLLQMLAWVLFLYAPLLLFTGAVAGRGAVRVASAVLGALLAGIGIDAVLIEPFDLQVRHDTIEVPGLSEPFRIALLADIQTHHVGDHEARALQVVTDAKPDLIVLAGDYIQLRDPPALARERASLAQQIQAAGWTPSLGVHAVEGDVDKAGWTEAFDGTTVQVATEPLVQRTVGPVHLVLLDLQTSRAPLPELPPRPEGTELTVVLGHRPDYSLGLENRGPDTLFLAGHTHGGQVQLPGVGPLITFSRVARDRAVGRSVLAGGASLVVSAGVGLERSTAPRIRFLCPPEVWILEVVPAD